MMTPRQLSPQLHQGRTESFDALGSHNGVWEVGGGEYKSSQYRTECRGNWLTDTDWVDSIVVMRTRLNN